MPKCIAIQFCGTQRALPDDGHSPSSCDQRGNSLLVVFAVALNLRSPKLWTCRRPFEIAATMTMPEAPIHENNGLVLGKNNVRLSGQVLDVQPKPETTRVQQGANEDFRVCVPAPDAGHHAASGVLVYNVSHGIKCSVDVLVALSRCPQNKTCSPFGRADRSGCATEFYSLVVHRFNDQRLHRLRYRFHHGHNN